MASRRVRIKGIANIPQRRKPVNAINGSESDEAKDNDTQSQEIVNKPNLNSTSDQHVNIVDPADKEISVVSSNGETSEVSSKEDEDIGKKTNIYREVLGPNILPIVPEVDSKEKENDTALNSNKIIGKTEAGKIARTDKPPINRRKFLKPVISVNSLSRKAREAKDEVKIEPNKENLQESANINLNEIEISTNNANSSVLIQKIEPPPEPNLDVLNIESKESTKSGSDTECQQPPTSPTKVLNRRIKAIPKLHQRRTSFSIGSASESEDDIRRTSIRNRNDSVCSANSGINETQSTIEARSPTRREYTVVQRKCRRTEQTRKFAEARREFNMKFNNGKPDKQKLTMIDLIFYNPATSPMSYNKRKRKSTSSSDVSDARLKPEEEKVDDPQPASESENELPAPQIKVGPNGEIIVDEKSLIIENAETKRSREALQMSELVDGDEDTSYGIYKKIKRPKEWTKEETLRFYKALNTIGTDFTLMCELFPNRTRRELKMKFKKEERLNQALINKAVMQPCEFDMTELRKDLEMEEKRAEEKKRRAEEAKAFRAAALEQRKNMKKGLRIKGIDISAEYFTTDPVVKEKPPKKKKKTAYDAIKRGINSLLSETDDDDVLIETADSLHPDPSCEDNDDPENVSKILKPTRYGRIPKARLPNIVNSNKQPKKKKKTEIQNDESQQGELEPGSIMIVKSKMPSDELVYKVYIVTDNNTKKEIDLTPNVLKNLSEIGGQHMEVEKKIDGIQAHNILTISAQECPNSAELNLANAVGSNKPEESLLNDYLLNSDHKKQPVDFSDTIIIPFDACLTPTAVTQNITLSHEDNKMIVVTENNKRCVLTT